jgi:DNA-binding NtrC family response regulator
VSIDLGYGCFVIKKDKITHEKKIVSNKKSWPSLKEIHRGAMTKAEADVILRTLEKMNWNRKRAARLLNISYKALLYKIKEYGLNKGIDSLTS